MAESITRITVFVASPGDVTVERDIVKDTIDRINESELLGENAIVQLKRCETHAWPGFGEDAQSVINHQIGPYDVFVGIMWNRIGTRTGRAVSGTVEEFETAYTAWKEHKRPSLMFYFNRQPSDLATVPEIEQKVEVVKFKQRLQGLGALYWEYNGPDDFRRIAMTHLIAELKTHMPSRLVVTDSTTNNSEDFTNTMDWSRLTKIGAWTFDSTMNEIRGSGVYEFLLSRRDYGRKDFRIKAGLLFANYGRFQHAGMDSANAGIVLGWQDQGRSRRYYNLLFTGRRLLLEAVGFRGADDYRDFKHFDEGVEFIVEDGRQYEIAVSVSSIAVDVFIDNEIRYSVATPKDIEGRVGLRPWRSAITCTKFVAYES